MKSLPIWALCLLPLAFCHADDLGAVSGFVKFPGETPPRNMFANASDHDCPHGIGQNHLLVKQETRGLENVLIILERQDRRVMPTRLQIDLRTEGCRLLPRLQWVPLGASLSLVDKDGASHHLRATQQKNTMFEADLTPETRTARRPVVVPGFYKVNCDRHPWERAWVYVSPHDSVAITDSQGRFMMKNVPPGRYTIHAWHEGWVETARDPNGRLEYVPMQDQRTVRVQEKETSEVTFDTLTPAAAPGAQN